MKISYRREIRHNYLIIDPEEIEWSGYECQMLAENQIDGILRFQLRQMDEGVRFYYEITSRQPLTRLLENRKVRASELRQLVLGIAAVLERMEVYLLREERVLLEPDYLYVEPETFRIFLCLVPGLQRDFAEDFGRLLEYLLGSVDHHDKESVILVYGMYQETRKENYGMEDVVRILYQQKGENRQNADPERQSNEKQLIEPPQDIRTSGQGSQEEAKISSDKLPYSREPYAVNPVKTEGRTEKKKSWWQAAKVWVQNKFFEKEDIPEKAAWEVMFSDNSEQEENMSADDKVKQQLPDCLRQTIPETIQPLPSAPEESLNTALLADFSQKTGDHILRALDAGEADIPISYYPFIIGKQDNLVDYKLNRDTVSRLHIRIDRFEERFRIQDLNSTNGTMVRGQLLNNNESVELESGDEVSIAQYRYRFE